MTNNNAKDSNDFEIGFYEALLGRLPTDIHILEALGCLYTEAGHYKKGLKIDLQAVNAHPQNPTAHYNLACSYALLDEEQLALQSLENAIDLGYADSSWMIQDEDLVSLHKNPHFIKLLQKISSK